MLYKFEQERDRGAAAFWEHDTSRTGIPDTEPLHTIEEAVEGLRDTLWPLNRYIHDNPELAFEEFKTHNALTEFMCSQDDWHVTMSAYGLETAWVAVYDSGKKGTVISFNAEMGMFVTLSKKTQLADAVQMHLPT
jgi:hypothetical protein